MDAAPAVLKQGGRLVVISFHSLEDRIVKDALRDGAKMGTLGTDKKAAQRRRKKRSIAIHGRAAQKCGPRSGCSADTLARDL